MHQLSFYVPESHLDIVKQALFDTGAGKIANYDCCCWQTKGEGQYRPLASSNPFLGEKNTICHEAEYKVEMVCEDHLIEAVIHALLKTHPYETPAFSVWPIRIK